ELGPQVVRRLAWLQTWSRNHNPTTFFNAVPRLRRRDARDLVRDIARGRFGVEDDRERSHARRFVLGDDELAVPRAGAPVDAAERIARPVCADPEQLV